MTAKPQTLSNRELNRALLARQLLLERKRISVPRVLERVAGLQTQEPRDAFISLWSRIDRFDPQKLRRAAERREIVRGSNLRCTIHTVTTADYIAFRRTLAEVIERDTANWKDRYVGLDKPAVTAAVEALLSDDVPRTGREIGETLQDQFPNVHREGLTHCARIHVPVVMTPTEDRWCYSRPPKLALAGRWTGHELAPDGAKTELLRRGIAAIGPCSTADLRTWSGLTGVREALEPLLPELIEYRDESGRTLYDLPSAPRPCGDTPAPVRFLGEFDNLFLSHSDRARVIDPEVAARFTPGVNGRRLYTFLVDGFVAGSWKIEKDADGPLLRVRCFTKLSGRQRREVESEAAELAALIEPKVAGRVELLAA